MEAADGDFSLELSHDFFDLYKGLVANVLYNVNIKLSEDFGSHFLIVSDCGTFKFPPLSNSCLPWNGSQVIFPIGDNYKELLWSWGTEECDEIVQFRVYFVYEINQISQFHISYQLEKGCNLWVQKFISSGTINSKDIFRSENLLCPLQTANCSFWFSPGSFERIFFSLMGNNDAITENFLEIEENKNVSKEKLFPRGKMHKAKNEGNHIYEVSVKEMDFALSFKKKSNCQRGLLTDTPGCFKINVNDFFHSECIFSLHAQYGYRIKLTLNISSGFCNFFHLEITDRERVRRVCTSLGIESIGNLMHWHIKKIFHNKSHPDDLSISVNYTFIHDFPVANKCKHGSFYFNGFCFELFLKRLNWTEAEMFCDQMDGNLATLKDEETSQSVYDIVRFSPHYKSKSGFWIGASSHRRGEYSWTSHEPFSYTNWFSGKTNLTDGFEIEEESCVEICQRTLALKGLLRDKRLAGRKTKSFFWVKRDCSKKNMFICETKPYLGDEIPKVNCSRFYILNSTLLLNFTLENSGCNITVSIPPESQAIIDFKAFSIRDSKGCRISRFEIKASSFEETLVFCGDLTRRLKHLKKTLDSGNVEFYFISPRKSHRQIIQLVIHLKRDQSICPNPRYFKLNGFCVLPVSYPRVTWNTAHETCKDIQAQLISSSVLDGLAVSELTREYGLHSFWIQDNLHLDGGLEISPELELNDTINQNNIEERYEPSSCPILEVINDKPQKRHMPCDTVAGYICQRNTECNTRKALKTFLEAEKGRITSPNFPHNYPANFHHEVEIKGPSDSQFLVTFTTFDVEPSDNCTFDYLELQGDKKTGIFACGSYEGQLQRLDFLSKSNHMRIIFSTDDSVEGTGFELNWRNLPLTTETEILHVTEEPRFLMSSNYPYFMLPGIVEHYILESSNDSRIMLEFRDLEIFTTNCSTYLEIEVDSLDRFKICSSEAKLRRSYFSTENKLVVRLVTDSLKVGRGFKAAYRSVPYNVSPIFNIFLEKGLNQILPVNYKSKLLIPSYNQKLIAPVRHLMKLQVSRYEDLRLLKDPYSLGIEFVEESKLNVAYIERDGKYDGIVPIIVDEDPAWNSKLELLFNSTLESCSPNPCKNNGDCFSDETGHHCHCKGVWKGPFCTINDCYSSPCERGICLTNSTTWWCACEEGFKGKTCSAPKEPCDYNPCGGKGLCSNFGEDFRCKCYPQWQGSRCETRLIQIAFKPLSHRMLEEPFWLGLLTVFTVLVLIGIAYCGKRHLKEKFEKFITEELERNGIQDFNCHDNPSRRNSQHYTSLDPMLVQHISPGRDSSPIPFGGRRSFLDRFGVRKFSTHSLLSVPDSTMHRQIATPENNRTLSLDDILKLSRKSRSPSPGRVSDCKIQQYTTPCLQPISIDVTYAQVEINPGPVEEPPETSLDARHEKRVTFARLLKKVQTELSSSLSDLSMHERRKVQERELHEKHPKPFTKRRGRWARARLPNSTSSTQGSASDIDVHDTPELSSSENVTPLRGKLLRLPARTNSGSLKSGTNSSAESLMSMFKSAVGSRATPSTPSSPQISEADLSSCFPTPLSTPGSPSDSCLSFSDQSLYSMSLESSNRRPNPSQQATSSLEIPSSSYCTLSPIRELPTPLPSPTPSPQPTPNLIRQTAIADKYSEGESSSTCSSVRSHDSNSSSSEGLKKPSLPQLKIILTDYDDKMEIGLNVPVISVTECDSNPCSPSSLSSPVSRPSSPKTKPPPIEIKDSNFTRFIIASNELPFKESKVINQRTCSMSQETKIPVLQIVAPSPTEETIPVIPRKKQDGFSWKTVNIGSPPVRKIPILTIESEIETGLPKMYLRDLQEKSNSLDFPFVPPIITITSSFSEIESDTESPDQNGSKTTMCYLSPFSCLERRPEMTSSESNLSSSGYSSMASPGPSPSTSSKTLCGADDMPLKAHRIRSKVPGFDSTSPLVDSPLDQKNRKRHFFRSDSEFTDQEATQAEAVEERESTLESNDDDRVDRIRERIDEGVLKSAKDLKDFIANIDLLPKPVVPKSQSLDSKNTIQRMSNLKSDSLDTKLMFNKLNYDSFLSLKPPTIVVQTLLTDDREEDRKLSPVSSRSESPLSDSKSFRFSSIYLGLSRRDLPFTDSDALYDYPSSEAITQKDLSEVAPQRHPKKIEKKRERHSSVQVDGSLALSPSSKRGKERSGKRRQQVSRAGTSSSSESIGQSVTLQEQSSSLPEGVQEPTRFSPLRQPARRRQGATFQPTSRKKSLFRRRFKRVQSTDGTLASADESDEL